MHSGQQVQQTAVYQNVQENTPPGNQVKDPGTAQKLALILLTAVIFILGIMPGPFIALAKRAAAELLMLR
jgi:NADH:ubiquinone oxidoreductase subunit 4 (subunit M)